MYIATADCQKMLRYRLLRFHFEVRGRLKVFLIAHPQKCNLFNAGEIWSIRVNIISKRKLTYIFFQFIMNRALRWEGFISNQQRINATSINEPPISNLDVWKAIS